MLLPIDYILMGLPGVAVAAWAAWRVASATAAAGRVESRFGLTGAEIAAELMRAGGMEPVPIEPAEGELSDHYDDARRVLRFSHAVHDGRSLAAMGLAAHEAGHALQAASRYPFRFVRRAIVPTTGLASTACWLLVTGGLFVGSFRLFLGGLYLFSAAVVLQLANLPVEQDASRRALHALRSGQLIAPDEEATLRRVLDAASWTHVAGTLTTAPRLLIGLIRASTPSTPG